LKLLAAAGAGASLGVGIEQAINGRKTDGKTLQELGAAVREGISRRAQQRGPTPMVAGDSPLPPQASTGSDSTSMAAPSASPPSPPKARPTPPVEPATSTAPGAAPPAESIPVRTDGGPPAVSPDHPRSGSSSVAAPAPSREPPGGAGNVYRAGENRWRPRPEGPGTVYGGGAERAGDAPSVAASSPTFVRRPRPEGTGTVYDRAGNPVAPGPGDVGYRARHGTGKPVSGSSAPGAPRVDVPFTPEQLLRHFPQGSRFVNGGVVLPGANPELACPGRVVTPSTFVPARLWRPSQNDRATLLAAGIIDPEGLGGRWQV
jgi:hypothetical protein